MTPLSKAKGLDVMVEDDADPAIEVDEEASLDDAKAAFKEGDWDGAVMALAAYVDACVSKAKA